MWNMGTVDTMTRRECIAKLREVRLSIKWIGKARSEYDNMDASLRPRGGTLNGYKTWPRTDSMADELRLRNETVELRARLMQIEVEERDALSLALQRATLEAEEKRSET